MERSGAYISKKQSWLRFAVSFIFATGFAALLCVLLREPRLGPLYDFLRYRRPALPIAREILIIDTLPPAQDYEIPENILEPSALASLLMTMNEFDASVIILQAPVLGLLAGSSAREEEICYRFDREFDILNRNIRNLFDAIRTGSILPGESARYVGELVELSEMGKERLIGALVSHDEEGIAQLERAAQIFGNVHRPGDLMVQLVGTGERDRPGTLADHGEYSRSQPDRDGVLRRISPQRGAMDHIAFSALKHRYETSEIISSEEGKKFLILEAEAVSFTIPLDLSGALLFEVPRRDEGFRRIPMADFFEYDEADRRLRILLGEAEAHGIYALIPGEENPVHLYDYAQSLKADLLRDDIPLDSIEDQKIIWKRARERYFTGLHNYLSGSSEMDLMENLEQRLSILGSGPEADQVRAARNSLNMRFYELRRRYQELLAMRNRLDSNLAASFCILGPARPLSDTEATALLANSIITGRAIIPGGELITFLGALVIAFLTAFILRSKGGAKCLLYSFFLTFLAALAFSLSFLLSGYWIDPLIPMAAVLMAGFISFMWALILKLHFSKLFRSCYGPFIASSGLKYLVRSGIPKPDDLINLKAVIVAIRNPSLQENRGDPKSAAAAILHFREKLATAIKKAGGMVAGNGGDLVLACFGSPLERVILVAQGEIPLEPGANAIQAAGFISDLLRHKESRLWSFGLDFGSCAFTWSPMSGYSVFGGPVLKARILCGFGLRYNARVLISASITEVMPEFSVKARGSFKGRDGRSVEAFYELLL